MGVREDIKPLLPDTPAGKVVGGSIVTAILGSLGFVGVQIMEVSREIQQVIDTSRAVGDRLSEEIADLEGNDQELLTRVRAIELEMTARQDVLDYIEQLRNRDLMRWREGRDVGPVEDGDTP